MCTNSDVDKVEVTKIVDAALVSVAETYRALSEYGRCVDTYRREIGWVTSTSLPNADLASSWFSLAQAQRLTCESDFAGQNAPPTSRSSNTADSLNCALQAARSVDNPSLMVGATFGVPLFTTVVSFHKFDSMVFCWQGLYPYLGFSSEIV